MKKREILTMRMSLALTKALTEQRAEACSGFGREGAYSCIQAGTHSSKFPSIHLVPVALNCHS